MDPKIRILIVDDEQDFAESVAFWLTSKGYEVTRAERGATAVELVMEGRHDILFLDINMPQMSGIEALRRIRAFNKTLPVIVVTAAYEDETKFADVNALGVSGFFPKEGTMTQLTQVLEVALRSHRTLKPPTG